jgi:hypothetical protein
MAHPKQLAIFDVQETLSRPYEVNLIEVARRLSTHLLMQQPLHATQVRNWMNREFNGTDADGVWKDVYEAQEVALTSVFKWVGKGLSEQDALTVLDRLSMLENLTLTQTKRSQESVELQQFSTPIPLAYLATLCAQITAADIVLEPSAGTGILAKFAELRGAKLILNEWSDPCGICEAARSAFSRTQKPDGFMSTTVLRLPVLPKPRLFWMTKSAFSSSAMRVERVGAITLIKDVLTSGGGFTTYWNRDGEPITPFRVWGDRTAPIKSLRPFFAP